MQQRPGKVFVTIVGLADDLFNKLSFRIQVSLSTKG